MQQKKHLSFTGLIKIVSERFGQTQDDRHQGKINYSIHDCYMSAFAMMFFQDKSLLEFQRRMQEEINRNNLKSIFNVSDIPKDTQLRDVLDNAPYDEVENIFSDFFRLLQTTGTVSILRWTLFDIHRRVQLF